MSLWNSLWASERFPGGSGLWRGGLWTSQRAAVLSELQSLIDDLYGDGQQGAFYIPEPILLDEQRLWQDAAGTVITDDDGEVIGNIDDLSPNDNDVTQSTASRKPLFKTAGGLNWMALDGVDDYLRSNNFGLSQPYTVSVAFYPNANGDFILDGLTINSGSLWVSNIGGSSGQLRMWAGSGVFSSNQVVMNSWNIATAIFDGANSVIRLSQTSVSGNAGTATPNGFTLGMGGDLTNGLAGRIAGVVASNERWTSEQIEKVESYLNDTVGGGAL